MGRKNAAGTSSSLALKESRLVDEDDDDSSTVFIQNEILLQTIRPEMKEGRESSRSELRSHSFFLSHTSEPLETQTKNTIPIFLSHGGISRLAMLKSKAEIENGRHEMH